MFLSPLKYPLTHHFHLTFLLFPHFHHTTLRIIYIFLRCCGSLLHYHLFRPPATPGSPGSRDSRLLGEVGSLLLQRDDLLHDVDEHAALQEGLPRVVLKAHYHHLHAQPLLRVPNAVYEVTVTREKSDTIDIRTQGVVYQVNGYCYVHLGLYFPFNLFLAAASALR
jgi:hypothetical protein